MLDTITPFMMEQRAKARKSTGPKTPEGKAASKMNGLKHGLLSKEVLVACHTHKESEEEFRTLHDEFMSDLKPVGKLEEALVDQIVTAQWRLRRVLTAEAGEIAQNLDEKTKRQESPQTMQLEVLKWGMVDDVSIPMRDSHAGCLFLKKCLTEVREAVERDGELTEATLANLTQHFAGVKTHLATDLEQFRMPLAPETDPELAAKTRERLKAVILKCLDLWIADYTRQAQECREREDWETLARKSASVLPSPEALEKIGRYESRLHRQMFRAIKELRSLQKEREEKQKAGNQRAEIEPRSEGRSENLRNEPSARSAVSGSELGVSSSSEPIDASQASEISHLKSEIEEKLPNEPIGASLPSEISNLRSQIAGNLPNEATGGGVK